MKNDVLIFNPPVIAHRGASAYAPENTMSAFIKAAQLGIKWIEFDVMEASCGKPIIFHDDDLDRTTNISGEVIQFPYSYLQTVDAGSWFDVRFADERIPTLAPVMNFLHEAKMSVNIEIKTLPGRERPVIEKALLELEDYFSLPNTTILFSSFSVDALNFLRKCYPEANLGLLLHEWEPWWMEVSNELNCLSIHVFEEIMTKEMAEKIKSLNKKLLCYTVNDSTRANELYSWGVDAVFSDMPDKIIKNFLR